VFFLLIRYLMAEYLCLPGWHESLCIIRSVVVGFLYMLKVNLLFVFIMVIFR
jgi:hypothetical protein